MMSKVKSSILFVPNHSVFIRDNDLLMESEELGIIKNLRANGWDVGVCSFLDDSKNTSLSGSVSRAEVRSYSLNFFASHNSFAVKIINYAYASLSAPFYVFGRKFAYVFCPGYNSYIVAFWCVILRVPFALYVRGVWAKNIESPSLWDFIFKKSRFLIVTGKLFKRLLSQHCECVENEVPLTSLRPESVECFSASGRSERDILYVGRLHKTKGVLDLIHAVGLLVGRGVDVRLKIAGGGLDTEIDEITRLALSLGVSDRVILLGHIPQDQLLLSYKQCGMFAFPSYYAEGFPRVIYEAMMLGMSIVTCEMPGTKEFIIHNRNCLVVPPQNPEQLSMAIGELIADTEVSARLRRQALIDVNAAFAEFKDDSHAGQLLRLINEVS